MAHKSRKKHIKHAKQHQVEDDPAHAVHRPGSKAASAARGTASSHKVRLTSRAKAAVKDRAGKVVERTRTAKEEGKARASRLADSEKRTRKDQGGLVRRIAKAATKKITAKPQRALSRARARVRSLLGRGKAEA